MDIQDLIEVGRNVGQYDRENDEWDQVEFGLRLKLVLSIEAATSGDKGKSENVLAEKIIGQEKGPEFFVGERETQTDEGEGEAEPGGGPVLQCGQLQRTSKTEREDRNKNYAVQLNDKTDL